MESIQAFYGIDKAVYSTKYIQRDTTKASQGMKPFEYLKSKEVLKAWERELEKLDKEIEVQNANVMSRINDIFRGIERLEKAMAPLRADFRTNQDNIEQQMLKEIQDAVDGRCLLIVKKLQVGTDN
jgi:hypothetical protein